MELVLVLIIVLGTIITMIIQECNKRKKITYRIQYMFGKERKNIDKQLDRLDMIEKLYLFEKNNLSENELVDDITWDDLNMNHVFASVNHTNCFVGEQCLYSMLHNLPSDTNIADNREEKITFFDKNEGKRIDVQKCLYRLGKDKVDYYIPQIIEIIEMQKIPFGKICVLLFISLVCFSVLSLIIKHPVLITMFVINYLINLVLYIFWKVKFEISVQSVFSIAKTIKVAYSISDKVGEFSSEVSKDLHALKNVTKMTKFIENKQALSSGEIFFVLFDYLLGALLIDFIIYDRILTELAGKQDKYMRVYKYVGEMDCAISIASYRKSLEMYCVPELVQDKQLVFGGVRHPLIKDAVTNDFVFDRNVIVTGSNASGKSTFIKSVAINLILGQSIHTCTAGRAIISDTCVLTSMAVRDDVVTGESYYIREIKYLKRMVERCTEGKLLFLAIDEILRGTNTKERVAASKAVLDYFKDKNCILMVATHDLELACYLENTYDNYYFCETVENGDVVFDYILRKGISKSSNAIRLLNVIGFPEEIVKKAQMELKKK